jgi:hypothetical protein
MLTLERHNVGQVVMGERLSLGLLVRRWERGLRRCSHTHMTPFLPWISPGNSDPLGTSGIGRRLSGQSYEAAKRSPR